MTTTTFDLIAAVELATLAPSVHNTQPWRFGVADGVLTLSRDAGRQLAVLDPTGRQQTVSCGAALHLARLALRVQGYDSEVAVLPDGDEHDVLARVVPVAGAAPTAEEVALAGAARRRHTRRAEFDDRPLARDDIAAIRTAAEELGAWVRVVDRPDELAALTVLLSRADDEERMDPAYREELSRWTGRAGGADGLPAEATPAVGSRASNLRLRDFDPERREERRPDQPPQVERPLAVVLGTEHDGPVDWLRAGEALMAMLLRATVDGVQAQPLGQVVDQEWTRARLGAELGVVGHPQMVLRLGYGTPGPDTPRRPARDVVT